MVTKKIIRDVQTLHALELKLEELIQLVERLKEENEALKQQGVVWKQEQAHLQDKYQHAKLKIEGVIKKLSTLEYARE